jgi:hypothetical protein
MYFRSRFVKISIITFGLVGCAHLQPDQMYSGDHPLSDTAVFSALDDSSGASVCLVSTIQAVDQNKTSRMTFPVWVRVRPGPHSFLIHCTTGFAGGYQSIISYRVELLVKMADMRPRHIYVARYKPTKDGVRIVVDDLGERSNYSLTVGSSLNRKTVKPSFENN